MVVTYFGAHQFSDEPGSEFYAQKISPIVGIPYIKMTVKSALNLGHVYAHRAEVCPESGA